MRKAMRKSNTLCEDCKTRGRDRVGNPFEDGSGGHVVSSDPGEVDRSDDADDIS